MKEKFNVLIEDGEDGYLISQVIGLPGCHTQAKTKGELLKRTKEAIELHLQCASKEELSKSKFLGLEQIELEIKNDNENSFIKH